MPRDIPLSDRIIFALDVPNGREAMALVERLESRVGFFKVGLQLFLAEGFSLVDRIAARGAKVMLDLKFHDIPKTVELAVSQFAGHEIALATVHGYAPTVKAAAASKGKTKILAVTVLTSMGPQDLAEAGYSGSVEDLVLARAQTAMRLGGDGVVCSGLEAARLRAALGPEALIVTPGIRPAAKTDDDQTRIVTAGAAVAAGADYVVVGRPIRQADAPLAVVAAMQDEIANAMNAG
jgi:orotidine-5'-phosphate decarboxylase